MSQKTAHKKYLKRFFPAMGLYLIGIFLVSWASNFSEMPSAAIFLLTLIPISAVFAWMWAHWRYILEVDEYIRQTQLKSMMFGMATVMALSAGWGLLEMFTEIPKIPIFFAMPGFYLFYGLAHLVIAKKEGLKGSCP